MEDMSRDSIYRDASEKKAVKATSPHLSLICLHRQTGFIEPFLDSHARHYLCLTVGLLSIPSGLSTDSYRGKPFCSDRSNTGHRLRFCGGRCDNRPFYIYHIRVE